MLLHRCSRRLHRSHWYHPRPCRGVHSSIASPRPPPTHPLPRESFDPIASETGRYQWWNEHHHFEPSTDTDAPSFSMILPPPNVTGVLHVGHALTVALQDSLARHRRMLGDRVLWVPGLDHAGIATQSVVEKRLLSESNTTRHDLGREKFLEQVWDWRNTHGRRIVEQLQKMGASLDWEQEFFTLDEVRSRAVVEAFVRLHNAGLIYRRRRHVNWCCALRTAISDIEVDHMPIHTGGAQLGPVPGHDPEKTFNFGTLMQFAYPICDRHGNKVADKKELVVATTRLETMLGDVAVAVHSEDQRYQQLHGMYCVHPFRDDDHPWKYMPIVVDDILVDPKMGTGAVKITPACDPEDYACAARVVQQQKKSGDGKAKTLPLNWNVFDSGGCITASCAYQKQIPTGMPRYEAREALEQMLIDCHLFRPSLQPDEENENESGKKNGKKKNKKKNKNNKQKNKDEADHVVVLPRCSRSGDVVEPRLLPQWYVRTTNASLSTTAAGMGPKIIEGGRHVKEWSRWLSGDVQDWCVSRQLWWGHRVPAWKIVNLQYETEKDIDVMDVVQKDSWLHQTLLRETSPMARDDDTLQRILEADDVDDNDEWIVARNEEDARKIALNKIWSYTNNLNVPISWHFDMEQDEDVLDTWFSSALLPLSSFGWPMKESSGRLEAFYPLSLMETGSDILFFWVARMAMLCSFLDQSSPTANVDSPLAATDAPKESRPPFEKVLLHPMVRDKSGRKMSKSLGNVIDPLDIAQGTSLENLIETLIANTNMNLQEKQKSIKDLQKQYPTGIPECGVDGLRFALCSYLEGSDMSGTINLDVQRAVSARHMCNKLWNASKFILSSFSTLASTSSPISAARVPRNEGEHHLVDRWILSRVANTVRSINENMNDFRLGNVTTLLRNHLIHDLCDVYIELSKKNHDDPIVQQTLSTVLVTYLKMLHPIMPYVTEDIYQAILSIEEGVQEGDSIMTASYPVFHNEWDQWLDDSIEQEFNNVIFEPAKAIRSLRKLAADTLGKDIAQDMYVKMFVNDDKDGTALLKTMSSNVSHVRQLCRHQAVGIVGTKEDRCNQGDLVPCLSRTLVLPNEAVIVVRVHLPNLSTARDMENAREKIQTELQRLKVKKKKIDKQLEKLRRLTSRPTYLTTAPKNVQELQHLKMNELRADAIDLENVASTLSGFKI